MTETRDYKQGKRIWKIWSNKRHQLIDIITIALCAVICSADTREVEYYGNPVYMMPCHFQYDIEQGFQALECFKRVDARVKDNYYMVGGTEPIYGKKPCCGRKINEDIIIHGAHNLYCSVEDRGLIMFVLYDYLGCNEVRF